MTWNALSVMSQLAALQSPIPKLPGVLRTQRASGPPIVDPKNDPNSRLDASVELSGQPGDAATAVHLEL